MDTQKVVKYAYRLVYILLAVLFLLIVLSVMVLEANKDPDPQKRMEAYAKISGIQLKNPNLPDPWPPVMNKPFPDMGLIDQAGAEFSLSDLKGKVLLIEYVDMTSPVSQAYSGAQTKGALGGPNQQVDEHTLPIEEIIKQETKTLGQVTLPNPELIMVKILIYNEAGGQAGPPDAERWASHFGFTRENGVIVTVPQKDARDKKTDILIPGFQLVDKEFALRVDSAGPNPKHSLNFRLVTMIPTLLQAEVE